MSRSVELLLSLRCVTHFNVLNAIQHISKLHT